MRTFMFLKFVISIIYRLPPRWRTKHLVGMVDQKRWVFPHKQAVWSLLNSLCCVKVAPKNALHFSMPLTVYLPKEETEEELEHEAVIQRDIFLQSHYGRYSSKVMSTWKQRAHYEYLWTRSTRLWSGQVKQLRKEWLRKECKTLASLLWHSVHPHIWHTCSIYSPQSKLIIHTRKKTAAWRWNRDKDCCPPHVNHWLVLLIIKSLSSATIYSFSPSSAISLL